MDYKPLTKPSELLLLQSLNSRMNLSAKEKQYLENLEKGYEGEKKFSVMLKENLPSKFLLLHDLLFEMNNSEFQIDSLLLLNKIYLFDVKNFEGDYYIEGNKWKSITGTEISNPLHQLTRCEQLLRKLLTELRITIPVEPYLIFINPEFTLYQAPLNQPIILPTQLNRLMKKLKSLSTQAHTKQQMFAEQLVSRHLPKSRRKRHYDYDFTRLKKGVLCGRCGCFMKLINGKLVCVECDFHENIDVGIIRSVQELQRLFPNEKITLNTVQEWCGVIESRKQMRRVLGEHLKLNNHGRYSYYTFGD